MGQRKREGGMVETQNDEELRKAALKRLKAKRDFLGHVFAYVVVNAFLVAVWYFSSGSDTYFWPMWVMIGWGIGVAFNAWDVYGRRLITEADVQRVIERQKVQVPPKDV
jgi:hypothetical protein